MRISVTTGQGEVVAVLTEEDVGDLEKPLPRAELMEELRRHVRDARHLDGVNRARENLVDNEDRK